jgi:hypothetical protein
MLIAAGLISWWTWQRFTRWLHEPPGSRLRRLAKGTIVQPDEATLFLEGHGYQVLSGKHRIPLGVAVDDGPAQATRLYFDYLAVQEDQYFLVKLERSRQPLDWTPSGLRERLLVYALLFPDCDGILVADPKERQLRKVRFQLEDGDE